VNTERHTSYIKKKTPTRSQVAAGAFVKVKTKTKMKANKARDG